MSDSGQRKNFIIKIAIVVIIACLVVLYMLTMRSNADGPGDREGSGDSITYIHFHVDEQEITKETYDGNEIIFPPAPKKDSHYFTGWYVQVGAERVLFTADYQITGQKIINVHAGFVSFKTAVKEFLQSGTFVVGGMNYVFSVQSGSVIIANLMPYSSHPFYADVKCKIEYDIFTGAGEITLIGVEGSEIIGFTVALDFSQFDYLDVSKGVSLGLDEIEFETGKSAKLVEDAGAAVSYLSSHIALAVEGLVRYIANAEQYNY